MGPTDKLYVVVRKDLPPGLQAAQACHASIQFALEHPGRLKEWAGSSNYICILSASDEGSLVRLMAQASDLGLLSSGFREPDLGESLTAIAIEPGESARLCRKLKPALREHNRCNIQTVRRPT